MMRKLMAANWKMYKSIDEAKETAAALVKAVEFVPMDREVLIFPPFMSIPGVVDALGGADGFRVGGQDLYPAEEGAFTGEISPAMLQDAGCAYALTGHSERRHVLGETDEIVGAKTAFGLKSGLRMVLCVGEKIEEREAGELEAVLDRQMKIGLADVGNDFDPETLSIAYEPVWAIGTGKVAGPEEIVEAQTFVRKKLLEIFGGKGKEMRILYGGSVKPENAKEIIWLDNVDGVLVGGASLQAESFSRIVTA